MNIQMLLERCLAQGRGILPRTYPTIYDRADQWSDFAYGLLLGINKMHKYPPNLSEDKRVEYLIRNAILYVKAKRFKAIRKHLVFFCQCGKRLSKRVDSFNQIKPCHGALHDVEIKSFVVYNSIVFSANLRVNTKSWAQEFDMNELVWTSEALCT